MDIRIIETVCDDAHLLTRANTNPEIKQLALMIEILSKELLALYHETHGGR